MSVPLGAACRAGDLRRVIESISAGHSADQPLDDLGTTPLMVAATVEVAEVVLGAGGSVDATRFGRDVLQIVVSDDESALREPAARLDVARLLLGHGAVLDRRDEHGWSRLYVAAFAGDVAAVEALIELGASPDDDPAPLAAACWGSGDELVAAGRIVDLLVAAGADVDRRDPAGWTLLHAAAMPYAHGPGFASSDGANVAALASLIRHGVAPDVVGPGGVTALMLAADDDALDAVDLLLAVGADPEVRDHHGDRAVDRVRESERRLTDLLATASGETRDAVRRSRDRVRECVERLSSA